MVGFFPCLQLKQEQQQVCTGLQRERSVGVAVAGSHFHPLLPLEMTFDLPSEVCRFQALLVLCWEVMASWELLANLESYTHLSSKMPPFPVKGVPSPGTLPNATLPTHNVPSFVVQQHTRAQHNVVVSDFCWGGALTSHSVYGSESVAFLTCGMFLEVRLSH